MNELNLLQAGLGNGTYYVAAEGIGERKTNSNEVEVDDIMSIISLISTKFEADWSIIVSFTATDIVDPAPVMAFFASQAYGAEELKEFVPLIESPTTVQVASGSDEYSVKVTVNPKVSRLPISMGTGTLSLFITTTDGTLYSKTDISNVNDLNPQGQAILLVFSQCQATFDKANLTLTWKPALTPTKFPNSSITVSAISVSAEQWLNPEDNVLDTTGSPTLQSEFKVPPDMNDSVTLFIRVSQMGLQSPDSEYGFPLYALLYYLANIGNGYRIVQDINGVNGLKFCVVPFAVNAILDAPVLTYAASERKLQWDDVEGALSYAVYKDGKKVGTVEDGQFMPEVSAIVANVKSTPKVATLQNRAVYDLQKRVVGYVDPTGKFISVNKDN